MKIEIIIVAQCALFLMGLFEPPGPIEDGRIKTISDGLREHQGIAMAIFVTLVAAVEVTMRMACFKPLACVLSWGTLAGFIGMMYFPNTLGDGRAHSLYAGLTLVSPTLLLTQIAAEGTDHHWAHLIAVYVALGAVCGSFSTWYNATGILELVFLPTLWLAWVSVIGGE